MKHILAKFVPKLLTVEPHHVQNFVAKHQIPYMPQPSYSPDMVLCDFPIPRHENAVEGEQVSRHAADKMKCNNVAIGYSKESVPKVLRTIKGMLKQVCCD
jgi:hypothetical protein